MTHRLQSMLGQSLRTLLVGVIVLAVALVAGVLSAGPGGSLEPTRAGAQAQASPTLAALTPTALPATATALPATATATATVVATPQGTPRPLLRLPSFPTASPAPQETSTTTAAPMPQETPTAATAVPAPQGDAYAGQRRRHIRGPPDAGYGHRQPRGADDRDDGRGSKQRE